MGVTIKEVAKQAGVATSTVSRVLHGSSCISKATQDKVQKVVKRLGYVPNASAQNLVCQKTRNIGLIFPVMTDGRKSDPFLMSMLSELTAVLLEDAYQATIISASSFEGLRHRVERMYHNRQVDGFILMYSRYEDEVLSYLVTQDIPFVMIGTPSQWKEQIDYVDNDNLSIGMTATNYLIEQGHQEIIFIGGSQKEFVYQERYNGYALAMTSHQFAVEGYDITDKESQTLLHQRLSQQPPTAFVVASDLLAIKLIPYLEQFQCYVGGNVGLISVNNSLFTTLIHPYLTSVDISLKTLVKQSVKRLMDQLQSGKRTKVHPVVPHELVIRESTTKYWQPHKTIRTVEND